MTQYLSEQQFARPLARESLNCAFAVSWKEVQESPGLLDKLLGHTEAGPVDLVCLLLTENLEALDLIWFKHLRSQQDHVRHHGLTLNQQDPQANRSGYVYAEDSTHSLVIEKTLDTAALPDICRIQNVIDVDLAELSPSIEYLAFLLYSPDRPSLHLLDCLKGHVFQQKDRQEIIRLPVEADLKEANALMMCLFSRKGAGWQVQAFNQTLNVPNCESLAAEVSQLIQD